MVSIYMRMVMWGCIVRDMITKRATVTIMVMMLDDCYDDGDDDYYGDCDDQDDNDGW